MFHRFFFNINLTFGNIYSNIALPRVKAKSPTSSRNKKEKGMRHEKKQNKPKKAKMRHKKKAREHHRKENTNTAKKEMEDREAMRAKRAKRIAHAIIIQRAKRIYVRARAQARAIARAQSRGFPGKKFDSKSAAIIRAAVAARTRVNKPIHHLPCFAFASRPTLMD
jgi:hypothetical protein